MNKIGFNLLAWSASIGEELLPIVERLKKIGYDGVECFIGEGNALKYRRFGEAIKGMGLGVTCVLTLKENENIVSPSAKVRKVGLDRIKWAIDRCNDLNSAILCGPFHSAHSVFSKDAPNQDEYKRSAEVLLLAGEYAANGGVILALEAVNRFECYLCNTMNQLLDLIKLVNHPNVKALYDTHHANIEEKNINTAIRRIQASLGHVHISENDRGTPGKGLIDWNETFRTLSEIGYKGWLTIEAFSRNDPYFANAINVWREFSPPWEIAEVGYIHICNMYGKYYI